MMLSVMTVVGARPQFIKAAVISRLIRSLRYQNEIREILIHTGQHYDSNMSDVFFKELGIPEPDVNLGVGSGSQGAMTGRMLEAIEREILNSSPDAVLVYGDTNSTLAGALAAAKLNIPVAHVEAGLRSFMMTMPEEQNRRCADHLSTWLFCPTSTAVENLIREGIEDRSTRVPSMDSKKVTLVGDVMLDASRYYREMIRDRPEEGLSDLPARFYLLTLHRAENTDDPRRLSAILEAVETYRDLEAVFPVHPRTRKAMERSGLSLGRHVRMIDPVGYLDMLKLEDSCEFVVTDSGGVQKEAYFFRKPCITLRDSTEWTELVDAGWNRLVGADTSTILAALRNPSAPESSEDLYGNGRAGESILEILLSSWPSNEGRQSMIRPFGGNG